MASSKNKREKDPLLDEFVRHFQQLVTMPFSQVKPRLDQIVDAHPVLIHRQTNTFQSGKFMSPLEIAIRYYPSLELIVYLVNHGADVNQTFSDGSPPLLALMYKGHPDAIRTLISAGADVNGTDKYGNTPLMYARSVEIARMLVENGAHLDLQDVDGKTALMYALSEGRFPIVEYLISIGAETQLLNKTGKSLQNFAFDLRSLQFVKGLLPREGGRPRKRRLTKKQRKIKKRGKTYRH